jgi:hypothetical protein
MKLGALRCLAGAAALLLAGPVLTSAVPAAEPGFAPIEMTAKPIDAFWTGHPDGKFGALEFRGGIELVSSDHAFGSLSGLDFAADGETVYAVTDTGLWFTARLVEEGGRLTGVEAARLAPILDRGGKPLHGKHLGDAEGLRLTTRGGREAALVSFEQVNDLRLFVPAPDLALAKPREVKLPPTLRGLSPNKGLESVAVAPVDGPLAGSAVLIAERSLDASSNNRAWVIEGPRAGAFSVLRTKDFDVTDADFLPDGDLLILERKFNLTDGLAMRIRRIAVADIKPGATVDGETLIEADMDYQIDNMEGLAVRHGADGETTILLVSDDNQSFLQRTLVLEFALSPDVPTAR